MIVPPLALVALIARYLLARQSHPRARISGFVLHAVLPFANLSSDKENEYSSDGLTGDLIDALTKAQGLHAVAHGSAFQFKGKNPDIRAAGRQLNVATVLEASVQRSGDRLRITAQLSSVGRRLPRMVEDLRLPARGRLRRARSRRRHREGTGRI